MGVLHDTFGIILDLQVEIVLVFLVPDGRKLSNLDLVSEQGLFNLEADDYVQAVSSFVSFDAYF